MINHREHVGLRQSASDVDVECMLDNQGASGVNTERMSRYRDNWGRDVATSLPTTVNSQNNGCYKAYNFMCTCLVYVEESIYL